MATAQKSAVKAKQAPAATPAKKVTPVADKPKPKTLEPHEIVTSSVIQNAVGIVSWGKFAGDANLSELVKDLDKRIDKIKAGDMSSVEAMLFGQAKVLETMFTSLARRASTNTSLKEYQTNLTLALKAQAQCRSTLEALAEIKNPRPVHFVKQANMTTGPQQVNNAYAGTPSHSGIQSGAENIQSAPNKLLEAEHGNYLDTSTQGAASRVNQTVEAVG